MPPSSAMKAPADDGQGSEKRKAVIGSGTTAATRHVWPWSSDR